MSLEDLSCKIECQDLLVEFAAALDRGDNDAAADLFTEDGELVMPDGKVTGPDIRKRLNQRSSEIVTHHTLSNMIVRPTGADAAEGGCYVQVYRVPRADAEPRPLPSTPQAVGQWLIGFGKRGSGWRIASYSATATLEPKQG